MDIKELRIGNYVMMNEQVIYMDVKMFHAVIHGFPGYEPKPIPINEEWFLKFGFIKEKEFYNESNFVYDKKDFGSFYKKEDYFLPTQYYFSEAFSEKFKLKYVHQLQNLHYALTEEELQIKKDG